MFLQTYELVPHPEFVPGAVTGIQVRWKELTDGRLMLRYRVEGSAQLVAAAKLGAGRGRELWRTTCFELFLHDGEGRYREFNFAPSQLWGAYAFTGYRSNPQDYAPHREPEIMADRGQELFILTAFIDLAELKGAQCAAISAVIEEAGGALSWWALAHNGPKPDFHDPTCFRLRLAPARAS
jgi:hypothetical protein